MTSLRLFSVVAVAGVCLLALKSMGLILGNGYLLTGVAPASAEDQSEAGQQAAADPQAETSDSAPRAASEAETPAAQAGPLIGPTETRSGPEGEIFESLSERRKALEERERELELRENLLKAAQKSVEERIAELKQIESRIEQNLAEKESINETEFTRLVRIYSGMKPKDAAVIFNQLDIGLLASLVKLMNPGDTAEIFSAMDPNVAERLTLELARLSEIEPAPASSPTLLPKIEGIRP